MAGRKGFAVASGGGAAPVVVDPGDFPGVLRAAGDLARDIGRVCGVEASLAKPGEPVARSPILVGTLGRSPPIDRLAQDGKLDVGKIRGQWEAYSLQTVRQPWPGVAEALVIVGSDRRGTIYGVYDLCENIGVSPWYWWADVPVVTRERVTVDYGLYVQGSPAVKYRGLFLNDEQPCLGKWTTEKFGGMNSQFYGRLFEVILRLRGNYLWPAMWDNAFAEDDPDNARLAEDYGVVMGTSHHEPMMRAHKEWTRRRERIGNGEWNYATNKEPLKAFFREGIARNKANEMLVTIGMRGDGDVGMASTGGMASDIKLLETIMADQRQIIADEMGAEAASVPQLWALFTEVQKFYDAGLQVPDDVTLLFTDDNIGNLRRLPTAEERGRKGGSGIYYHMDMNGGPFSYKWLNSNPLPKIWEQMNLAHKYGATQIWIANVGDFKPLEIPIEFFLRFAWDPDAIPKEKVGDWTRQWARTNFGPGQATEIADLVARYGKFNGWRKPELVKPDTYSLVNYREAERVLAGWKALVRRAEAVEAKLPRAMRDAYYQLVLHPIRACANATEMQIAAARNQLYARQARASTNAEAAHVRTLFARDRAYTDHYNTKLSGGKWNHLMDQTHLGYFDWFSPVSDIPPAVIELAIPNSSEFGVAVEGSPLAWPGYYLGPKLPPFDSLAPGAAWVEVFPRGAQPIKFEIAGDQPWIRVTETERFGVGPLDRRFLVEIDWDKASIGANRGAVIVSGAKTPQTIEVTAFKASAAQAKAAAGASGGLSGPFAIAADAASRNIAVGGVRWEAIADYGRVKAAMSPFPVTAPSFDDPRQAPRLEYPVYFARPEGYQIDLVTNPTLNVNPRHQLGVAVAIDDQDPQVVKVFTPEKRESEDFLGKDFYLNGQANARTLSFVVTLDAPGRRTLKIMMIDPTMVIQKIIIHDGKRPESYFGPPASGDAV